MARRVFQGPSTESLFRDETGRIVRIYGDDHSVIGNSGAKKTIEEHLKERLEKEPRTKVFGEFAANPDPHFENQHLTEVGRIYYENQDNRRAQGRIKNIDESRAEILDDFDMTQDVEQFLQDLADELTKDKQGRKRIPIYNIGKTQAQKWVKKIQTQSLIQELNDIDLEDEENDDDVREITDELARPLVEHEALKHIRKQPANSEYIFYMGNGHKDELDRVMPYVKPNMVREY